MPEISVPLMSLNDDRQITLVDFYSNEVVWAWIEDSQHRRATICIDGRAESATRNRLFERARHPAKPGAVLVELGAPAEGIAVALLSAWCDDDGAIRRNRITEEGVDIIRNLLLHLGDCPA